MYTGVGRMHHLGSTETLGDNSLSYASNSIAPSGMALENMQMQARIKKMEVSFKYVKS